MVDNKTGGPSVYMNSDGSFKLPKGRITSMPKQPKISNLAPPGTFDSGEEATTPEVAKKKSKSKKSNKHLSSGSNFGPDANFGNGSKPKKKTTKKSKTAQGRTRGPDKKSKSTDPNRDLLNKGETKPKRPMSGKVLGQRLLGLRAEMRKLQKRINKATHLLKAQRKEVKAMQTELFDLMDNTEQMNLPFN